MPPSSLIMDFAIDTDDCDDGRDEGWTMSLVRTSSSGERKRWVMRCDATCRPRGRAGDGYEASGSWKDVLTSVAESGMRTSSNVCRAGSMVVDRRECTVVMS